MERIQRILNHSLYKEYIEKIKTCEQSRAFCRHNTVHFLDVARIAWILNLEKNLGIDKELIYATALLHDIGRFVQYDTGEDHATVSARLAPTILDDCGFTEKEKALVIDAIAKHRVLENTGVDDLTTIIYRADKLSRACYFCEVEKDCNWKNEKKNKELTY